MRLRTKIYYMLIGSWAALALLLALMARPMCIGASLLTAFYWRMAEASMARDIQESSEKQEGE
jgi:hypothetical protein